MNKVYWNNQKYSECQLVSLWNAAIFHGIEVPKRYGKEYVNDCKIGLAINGSCLKKDHVIKKLNLKSIKHKINFRWVIKHLPCEFSIHCHRGFHSILAVSFDRKRKNFCIVNYIRNKNHYLSWNELKKLHHKGKKLESWVPNYEK
jgi:hypothetical protein